MRTTAAALLMALPLAALAGCGNDGGSDDDQDSGGKTAAGTDDFCHAITGFAAAAQSDDWPTLRKAADKLEDAGLPEDAPEDAGKGYDLILEVVRKYDSNDEVEKNITGTQDDQVEALLTYTDGTCADGHAPHEGSETPSR